jgi:hypothetical protein
MGVFVGRADELAALAAAAETAAAGNVAAVLIVGEPGSGKSRLLHEAAARARLEPQFRSRRLRARARGSPRGGDGASPRARVGTRARAAPRDPRLRRAGRRRSSRGAPDLRGSLSGSAGADAGAARLRRCSVGGRAVTRALPLPASRRARHRTSSRALRRRTPVAGRECLRRCNGARARAAGSEGDAGTRRRARAAVGDERRT